MAGRDWLAAKLSFAGQSGGSQAQKPAKSQASRVPTLESPPATVHPVAGATND